VKSAEDIVTCFMP